MRLGGGNVDVFDLDQTLVRDYEWFARSFTQIRARDIQDRVEAIYASKRFWPEPLITINPHFARDVSVETLAADAVLRRETAAGFGPGGQPTRTEGRRVGKGGVRTDKI